MNKKIFYSGFFILTLVTFTSLLTFANINTDTANEEIIETNVRLLNNVKEEYLVNDEIDLTNVELKIKDNYISALDCKVSYDFSSSGDKVITLSYDYENKIYQGYYKVKVFSIRHLDIRNNEISQNSDGTWDYSKLVVWAELNAPCIEFNKPKEYPELKDTVIILNNDQYSFSVEETNRSGYYVGHVKRNLLDQSFSFITNKDDPKVDSIDRILDFTNASNTNDKLTLFVTKSSNNFTRPNGNGKIEVSGIYVLENNNTKTNYQFAYTLDGWASSFESSKFNEGLVDKQGYQTNNDYYQVSVNGLTFYATDTAWHKAILNM